MILTILSGLLLCNCAATPQAQDTRRPPSSTVQLSAAEVVKQLAQLGGGGLPPSARSRSSPQEQLRLELYTRLTELGDEAIPALTQGLQDPNVLVRRNVALFLLVGQYFQELRELGAPPMNTRPLLPDLIKALKDSDGMVRAWAAQAIGDFGPDAAAAVPDLITLLGNPDEGSRNSACIALRAIGKAANAALPALRQALSDPSKDVRSFAALAIKAIE